MLNNWRIVLLFALVVLVAIWLQWWASLGFPLSHQICGEAKTPDDCDSYNIFFYSAWAVGKALDHWSALITALATGAIGYFTLTLKRSTDKLWLSGEKQIGISTQMADFAEKQLSIIALQTDIQKKQHAVGRLQFLATHRPRVILRYIQGPQYNEEGHQFIWLTFVNIGANDAIIDAFGGDLAYRGGFNEDWQIPGLDADLKEIQPITLACGQRQVFTVTAKTSSNTDEAISKSVWPGFQICAVGILRYRDGNGISRHTGFFRVLNDEGMRFVISEHDSEMEYQD